MNDQLKHVEGRLAAMKVRSEGLRVEIAARDEQQKALVEKHDQAINRLEIHLGNAKEARAAELAAHKRESEALVKRRQELKEDYGAMYEIFGTLQKVPSEEK